MLSEDEAGLEGLADALVGDAKDEDFSQGHFLDVIWRGTGGWGMIGCGEGTAPGLDGPVYRRQPALVRKIFSIDFPLANSSISLSK